MGVVRCAVIAIGVLTLGACTHSSLEKNKNDGNVVLSEQPLPPPPPPAAMPDMSVTAANAPKVMRAQQAIRYQNPVYHDRENYLHTPENSVKRVAETPVSTFSIDVDTASYSNVRRMLLNEGRLPPKDAVRVEEMINYFDYNYPVPCAADEPFSVVTEVAPAPWNDDLHLLSIGLKGYEPEAAKRPDANLVFLIDVSGSMQSRNKLPLVKRSLRLLTKKMRKSDRIAVVVYAGAAGVALDSTSGNKKKEILNAIDNLQAGGSTHGSAGIHLAYQVAEKHFIKDGINRVLIASDGDMNVGVTNIQDLLELIGEKRKSGIALTTLGFGTGNYNDGLMEQLADAGDGNAAYIDNLKEARKVMVTEMASTLLTIARDVKIQIEFNPKQVAEYRLIGYENRLLNREDFTNDKIDAGDIGAGHTVTALYEIAMVGSDAARIEPLRYGSNSDVILEDEGDELAFVKLRYKRPGESESIEMSQAIEKTSVVSAFTRASEDFRFASMVAGFGEQLRGTRYTQYPTENILANLKLARGDDEHGYRRELSELVEFASSMGLPN